jgi:UDP-GlcNAc:undecaprenyl-phosphate GlcNAc-1-phosphate transferase
MDLLILFLIALVTSVLMTPVWRWVAARLGIVDRPGPRKIHAESIPYLGGVSFHLSLIAVIAAILLFFPSYWSREFTTLIIGASMVLLLGLYDDVRGASATLKFPLQILIALFMYWGGYRISSLSNPFDLAGGGLSLSFIGLPATLFWYVALMNAVNLIDGADGLAGGVVAIASGSLFMIGYSEGSTAVCVLALTLAGSTIGFLLYNFPPASVFMGDTGSLLLGFLIASAGVLGSTKSNTVVAMAVPLIALGVTLLDTALAFFRRLRKGQHPFRADQHHIHHRLLRLGLTPRQVVLIIYYCSLLFSLVAYLLSRIDTRYGIFTIIILLLGVVMGLRILHFVESATGKNNHERARETGSGAGKISQGG